MNKLVGALAEIMLFVFTVLIVVYPNPFITVMGSLAFANYIAHWVLKELRLNKNQEKALASCGAKIEKLDIEISQLKKDLDEMKTTHAASVKQYEITKKMMSEMQLSSVFVPRAKRREAAGSPV